MVPIRANRALWLPLLALLLVLPACSETRPRGVPPAAVVDGVEIPREEAFEFAAVASSVAADPGTPVVVPPALDATVASDALTLLVQSQIAADVLAQMGGEITEADREQAAEEAAAAVPNSEAVDRVAEVFAPLAALENHLAQELGDPAPVTDQDIEAYFEENSELLEESCARVILVTGGGELAAAQEQAAQLQAELDDGAQFADLAREHSEDPDSATDGGKLPCAVQGQWSAVDPALDEAIWALEPGEVSDPVMTQYGIYLVKVDSRSTPSLEEASPEIRQALEEQATAIAGQQATDRMAEVLGEAMIDADVEVDARFGRWALVVVDPTTGTVIEAEKAEEAQFAAVLPPAGPATAPTTATAIPLMTE